MSKNWLDRKVWFNELDGRARCAECNQIMFDVREHFCHPFPTKKELSEPTSEEENK